MSKFNKGLGIKKIGKILGFSALGFGLIIMGGCSADSGTTKSNNNLTVNSNGNSTETASGYEDIDAAKFKELIKEPNTVVVDVRTQGEYDSGHVAKSLLIPVDTIEGNLNKLDKSKPIILVCRSGRRSSTAAEILVKNGFIKVKNLVGGLAGNPDLISE